LFAQQVGLKISQKRTEVMMLNVPNPLPVKVNGEDLPTTEEFTYLSSTVRHDGRVGSNIRNRLNKARNAFRMLNNVWKSSQYSTKTIVQHSCKLLIVKLTFEVTITLLAYLFCFTSTSGSSEGYLFKT